MDYYGELLIKISEITDGKISVYEVGPSTAARPSISLDEYNIFHGLNEKFYLDVYQEYDGYVVISSQNCNIFDRMIETKIPNDTTILIDDLHVRIKYDSNIDYENFNYGGSLYKLPRNFEYCTQIAFSIPEIERLYKEKNERLYNALEEKVVAKITDIPSETTTGGIILK